MPNEVYPIRVCRFLSEVEKKRAAVAVWRPLLVYEWKDFYMFSGTLL